MNSRVVKIKKRPDFLRIAKHGQKVVKSGFVLQALRRTKATAKGVGDTDVRIGYTASKKVGKAVVRNRSKRRLRALCAALLPTEGTPGFDYVLIARYKTADAPYQKLLNDLKEALTRINEGDGAAS